MQRQYRGWDGTKARHDFHWHDSISVSNNLCPGRSPEPCDDHSHGTHTLGIALGDDGGDNQIGMAPDAQWIGCRGMNHGEGSPATYLECFEFFLAPYPRDGGPAQGNPDLAPDVTINSWGCPPFEGCEVETLQAAVEAHRAAGIMTVVAAGNDGRDGCQTVNTPPSLYEAVYTVGALNTGTDSLAVFSSRGPVSIDGSQRLKPDLVAPGTNTRSSVLNGDYDFKNGTSMAAPHVAGAVALLWSAAPYLHGQVAATEALLNRSPSPIASSECGSTGSPNPLYGHGRLDVLAAVQELLIPRFSHSQPTHVGRPITFTNLNLGPQPLTSTWHFGDDSPPLTTGTDLRPVQHTYAQSGAYTLILTVSHGTLEVALTQTLNLIPPFQYGYYLPIVLR